MPFDDDAVVASETDDAKDASLELELESAAIQRLISEVRSGAPVPVGHSYDRVHNRHNR